MDDDLEAGPLLLAGIAWADTAHLDEAQRVAWAVRAYLWALVSLDDETGRYPTVAELRGHIATGGREMWGNPLD